ncbi:hypothetical protein ACSLPC_27920 [Escherichia coli]|uniref:hypothetical protein n=1 Tax=Escherichia coli TaxID=562 RepID=UPI003EE294F0
MNKTMRLQQKTEVIHNTLKKSVPYDLAKVEGLVNELEKNDLTVNKRAIKDKINEIEGLVNELDKMIK